VTSLERARRHAVGIVECGAEPASIALGDYLCTVASEEIRGTRAGRTRTAGRVNPTDEAEAELAQREVASRVEIATGKITMPRTIVGLDVSYETATDRVVAAAVVMAAEGGGVLEEVVVNGTASFPYVPGLLAFREVPILLATLGRLRSPVGLLLCDGHGLAHPRRCGVACHLGVETGLPAIGCAKSHFVGEFDEPGPMRGDRAPLLLDGNIVGQVLRTRDGVRPVFVSPGHRIGVAQAADVVLGLCSAYRLPDPIRRADHISRRALR